jgi:thiamine biosynthesis lipoprotein ApbE
MKNIKKYDSMTTVLGLCQCLLHHLDIVGKHWLFKKTLKYALTFFVKELENMMNEYFANTPNEEERYNQGDILNEFTLMVNYCSVITYSLADMAEDQAEMYKKEYDELNKKYGMYDRLAQLNQLPTPDHAHD